MEQIENNPPHEHMRALRDYEGTFPSQGFPIISRFLVRISRFRLTFTQKYGIMGASIVIPGEIMELYNLRSTQTPAQYIIAKFDKNMELESNYLVSMNECACPRGERPTCRHRQMLSLFLKHKHVDDGWFLDFHTKQWHNVPGFTDQVDEADRSSAPDTPAAEETAQTALPTDAAQAPAQSPHPDKAVAAGGLKPARKAINGILPL